MKKTKVICIGEALIDRIINQSDLEFNDFCGGAPANVACALSKLQIKSVFIGRLGDDEYGIRFLKLFKQLSINTDCLQLDKKRPTRIVKVNRDNTGDRSFSGFEGISVKGFSDEALDINLIKKGIKRLEILLKETKYIVTGTVLLSSPASEESIKFILNYAQKYGVKIIIDLNWREVFWDYADLSIRISKQERFEFIKEFLNYADILKLAREEAVMFFDNDNPYKISQKMINNPDVIITDGKNPISWFINGIEGTTEVPYGSDIIDTTGGGDAFLAGLISQLINNSSFLQSSNINEYVRFASVCGLITCQGQGAIEPQPNLSEVNEFIGSQKS